MKWEAHYIYLGYAAIVFVFEAYITKLIIDRVNNAEKKDRKDENLIKPFSWLDYLFPLYAS